MTIGDILSDAIEEIKIHMTHTHYDEDYTKIIHITLAHMEFTRLMLDLSPSTSEQELLDHLKNQGHNDKSMTGATTLLAARLEDKNIAAKGKKKGVNVAFDNESDNFAFFKIMKSYEKIIEDCIETLRDCGIVKLYFGDTKFRIKGNEDKGYTIEEINEYYYEAQTPIIKTMEILIGAGATIETLEYGGY